MIRFRSKQLDASLLTQDAIPPIPAPRKGKLVERRGRKAMGLQAVRHGSLTGCQVAERIGTIDIRLAAARARGAWGADANAFWQQKGTVPCANSPTPSSTSSRTKTARR